MYVTIGKSGTQHARASLLRHNLKEAAPTTWYGFERPAQCLCVMRILYYVKLSRMVSA